MKKILALIAIVALSGCAVGPYGETYVDPVGAAAVGAVAGGVIGYGIANQQPRYYAPPTYYAPARPFYGPRPGFYGPRPGYYGRPGYYR